MVPVAHGSDGGGSIRLPAAACSLVRLKPTRGRINIFPSTEWLTPVSVQGFQTRTVRDLAGCMDFASGSLLGDPMPPPPPQQPYASEAGASVGKLRIGLWNRLPGDRGRVGRRVQTAVDETGKLLESLGHDVELAHPSILDDPKKPTIFNRIWPVRLLAAVEYFERKLQKKAGPENLDPDTLFWLERARGVSAGDYLVALEDMDEGFYRRFLSKVEGKSKN